MKSLKSYLEALSQEMGVDAAEVAPLVTRTSPQVGAAPEEIEVDGKYKLATLS